MFGEVSEGRLQAHREACGEADREACAHACMQMSTKGQLFAHMCLCLHMQRKRGIAVQMYFFHVQTNLKIWTNTHLCFC